MKTHSSLRSALFESRHLALCILDNSGNVLEVNRAFLHQFGELTNHSSTNKSVWSLPFWPKNFSAMDKVWKQVMEDGSFSFRQHLQLDGKPSLYEIDFQKIDKGEVLVEFFQKESQIKVPSTNEEHLYNKGRGLDKLASLISHDLRAPLANTAYLLSLFTNDEINKEELADFVGNLKKSNDQTLNIIDELGELINAKLQEKAESTISLQSMISDVLKKFEVQISQTKARVVVDIHDHRDWKVPQGAFQMILGHVISNSLKYRKPDETPKIVITCSRKKGDRVIEVTDNGVGFDVVENKHRLFGVFQTFHDHPDARGIGLFQVKNRLLSIGGGISLDSQKGIGTRVTLNFKQNELEEAPLHY